jgi:hypothetical protein
MNRRNFFKSLPFFPAALLAEPEAQVKESGPTIRLPSTVDPGTMLTLVNNGTDWLRIDAPVSSTASGGPGPFSLKVVR